VNDFALTLTQRRLRRQRIPALLKELQALTGREVHEEDIESLEQLYEMQSDTRRLEDGENVTQNIPFSDRNSERFRIFIGKLKETNPSSIYIFAENSHDCGTLLVPSLDDINFNFDFSINWGLLSFITSDYSDSLLIDFSISDAGEEVMDIIRRGRNWAKVDY